MNNATLITIIIFSIIILYIEVNHLKDKINFIYECIDEAIKSKVKKDKEK